MEHPSRELCLAKISLGGTICLPPRADFVSSLQCVDPAAMTAST